MGGNMLLRNKKTGQEGNFIINKDHFECVDLDCVPLYFSISELLDEWEDYAPKEPLIKDEKIRKAVRAWAEANGREYLLVIKSGGRLEISDGSPHLIYISFHVDNDTLKSLDDRTYYPIAELCGEEEE